MRACERERERERERGDGTRTHNVGVHNLRGCEDEQKRISDVLSLRTPLARPPAFEPLLFFHFIVYTLQRPCEGIECDNPAHRFFLHR